MVAVVLGYRALAVDIGTEIVEIAASPGDTHSVETAGLGEDWERNSPVVDSIQVENYWRLAVDCRQAENRCQMAPAAAAVDLADLEGAVESTALPGQTRLAGLLLRGLDLGYRKERGRRRVWSAHSPAVGCR